MTQPFRLDPIGQAVYLEAVLVDAGLNASEANFLARTAHDCGGGGADLQYQRDALENAVEKNKREAAALLAKARTIETVITAFYADPAEARAAAPPLARPDSSGWRLAGEVVIRLPIGRVRARVTGNDVEITWPHTVLARSDAALIVDLCNKIDDTRRRGAER